MDSPIQEDLTDLLIAWSAGDEDAQERLISAVYPELHRMAKRALRARGSDCTLSPTEVVHEAYLRLIDQSRVTWKNRRHFYAIAATIMRRVLFDHARERGALKRGGGATRVSLKAESLPRIAPQQNPEFVLAVDRALERLGQIKPDWVRIVELRAYLGLTIQETADLLESTPDKIRHRWESARRWLFELLKEQRQK